MSETMPRTAAQEWRAHWPLVFAGLLGFSLSAIASISLGVFTQPLEAAFAWSRKEVNAGVLAYSVGMVVLSPLFGNMVDRWGPRRVGIPGVILTGLAFALFGTATGSLLNSSRGAKPPPCGCVPRTSALSFSGSARATSAFSS